jgi:hypothetical protein
MAARPAWCDESTRIHRGLQIRDASTAASREKAPSAASKPIRLGLTGHWSLVTYSVIVDDDLAEDFVRVHHPGERNRHCG